MANVFIEASTMTAIGDAIRAKTGGMAQIYPEDMPAQIASITTGGSGDGSDLVRYVTFLDEDGSELFKMPVLVGDDCKDPVTRGDISTPAKESTNTQVFTHSGWTSTVGGTADSSILKNITADKTVYVAYAVSVRYYTVNFYDEDGTTLLKTVEATYGQDLSDYVPVREGYDFVEWNPSVSNITSEFDTVAVWVESAKDEWDYIAESVAAGTYKTDYAIGDVFPVTIWYTDTSAVEANMILVAFDHDNKADGTGKAAMTFISEKTFDLGALATSENGWWGDSQMRSYCGNSLLNFLPTNVKEYIKPVTKLSAKPVDSTMYSTTDSIWVPSFIEVGLSASSSNGAYSEGTAYSRWFTSNARRIKNKMGTNIASQWQLRSRKNSKTSIYFISEDGRYSQLSYTVTSGYYAPFGFCI